jgi:hypothetical protein
MNGLERNEDFSFLSQPVRDLLVGPIQRSHFGNLISPWFQSALIHRLVGLEFFTHPPYQKRKKRLQPPSNPVESHLK